jgi:RimJ/RimL family protein N-acetyltransferase
MQLILQNDSLTTEHDFLKLMEWRNNQRDILRTQRLLTPDDQKAYYRKLLDQDIKRFSNNAHMWGIVTWEGDDYANREFIGYCGLTNMVWGEGFVVVAETSFIVDTGITFDDAQYEEVFTFFLTEVKRLFFNNSYWRGQRLHSETYDLPHRQHHISILEANGFKREGVMRNHMYRNGKLHDSIIHGMTRGDYEDITFQKRS